MKSKWLLLTKIQLMGMLDFNKSRYAKDAKLTRRTAGSFAIIAIIALVICVYSVIISIGFCEQGIGAHLPAFLIAVTSLVTLMFSLMQGCSPLFAMKDYDHVMTLPVKKSEILASRLVCIYLSNLLFALPVVIPGTIVLFVVDGFSFAILAVTLVATILSPLLPMAIAITLSALLTALTAKFRYKNILQIILSLILFLGVMIASFAVSFTTSSNENMDMNAIYSVFVRNVYLPAALVDMTLTGTIWGIFAFAGISIAVAVLFVVVLVLCYERVHEALSLKSAGSKYKSDSVRASSVFSALIAKEFRRLFSSSGYLLNALCGTFLLVIIAIVLLFVDPNILFSDVEEPIPLSLFAYAGAGFAFLFIGMSNPAASALSMEGKSREQLFVLPLTLRQIILAKTAPTFIFNAPAGLIFSVVFCLKFEADTLCWIITLISVLLFSAFCALMGSFLNYKFPKYDWANPIMAAKNSVPVMICVFGSMILGILCIVLGIIAGFWIYFAVDIICIICTIAVLVYFSKQKSFSME